jgi:uncharacterized protein (TIGR02271 family)
MPKTIVGMFATLREAQAAEQAVVHAGFPAPNVQTITKYAAHLADALQQAGVDPSDAHRYSQHVQHGHALVVAQAITDADAARAARVVDQHTEVGRSGQATPHQHSSGAQVRTQADATSIYQGNEIVIPIIQETLVVSKHDVDRGGVQVHVGVDTVPVQEQVTLREEHVQVERRPVNRPVSDADMAALQSGSIEVRETAEQAVVSKDARVVEEVTVTKDVEERTETVRDTVRHTVVEVEQLPGSTTVRRVGDTPDDRRA